MVCQRGLGITFSPRLPCGSVEMGRGDCCGLSAHSPSSRSIIFIVHSPYSRKLIRLGRYPDNQILISTSQRSFSYRLFSFKSLFRKSFLHRSFAIMAPQRLSPRSGSLTLGAQSRSQARVYKRRHAAIKSTKRRDGLLNTCISPRSDQMHM